MRRGTFGLVGTRPVTLALAASVTLAASAAGQVTFEGLVTDFAGVPQPDVDLDFFDAQSGLRVDPSAPGWESQDDKTDFQGRYEMVVVPEVYHVRYEPPTDRPDLAPVMLRNLFVGTDYVADVTLPRGARLEGRVVNEAGNPVADVDLDFRDPVTGARAVTVRDNTGADGRYDTTILPGVWDVELRPVAGRGVGPAVIPAFDLRENASLDVTLPEGFVLRGIAKQPSGIPVPVADIDVDDPSKAQRVPTANDNTDLAGVFAVAVPAGTFHIFVTPPRGLTLAPAARWDVTVAADVDLGDIVLSPGVVFSGTALDPAGAPLAGADLDLFRPGTCERYPATADSTSASGRFSLRVEAGTYDVVVRPSAGSAVPPWRFENVDLSATADLELRLPGDAPAPETASARVTDASGLAVAGAVVSGEPMEAGGAPWETTTGPDGTFTVDVVPGRYSIELAPPAGRDLAVRLLPSVDLPCGLAGTIALLPGAPPPPPPGIGRRLRGFPNPSVAITTVQLDLPGEEPRGELAVYDLAGRQVRLLSRGAFPPGLTEVEWDGRNDAGRAVTSGIYFLRLTGESARLTAKIARLRP